MALLSFKLNAFDGLNGLNPNPNPNPNSNFNLNPYDPAISINPAIPNANLNEFLDLVKKSRDKSNDKVNYGYKLMREEELKNDNNCPHCPKYLLLTDQINNVIDKIAKDPNSNVSDELPVKINRLKFLFYTEALQAQNGQIKCQRFMDITPDLKPTRFDGQFKLIAEDALKFNSVSEIQFMDPKFKEVVYYYRGEGTEKNIVIQAILTKEGGKFRYFHYTPSESESNPYNLPDLNAVDPAPVKMPAIAETVETKESSANGAAAPSDYKVKFKTELETRNKFIPKNVHFVEASVDHEIMGGLSVKGSSDTSIKGNVANIALKKGNENLVIIDLNTKLNGTTEHRIVVPYSIRSFDAVPDIGVKGRIELESNNNIATMSLTDKSMEFLRAEYRRNNNTNRDSYVLARDIQLDKNEVLSLQLGKGEDDKNFVSLKHAKSIKDNMTLVLDVRVDNDKKVSLFYQVSAKF